MLAVTKTLDAGLRKLEQEKTQDADLVEARTALVEKSKKLLYDLKFADEICSAHLEDLFRAFDLVEDHGETNEHANMFDAWLCGPDEAS